MWGVRRSTKIFVVAAIALMAAAAAVLYYAWLLETTVWSVASFLTLPILIASMVIGYVFAVLWSILRRDRNRIPRVTHAIQVWETYCVFPAITASMTGLILIRSRDAAEYYFARSGESVPRSVGSIISGFSHVDLMLYPGMKPLIYLIFALILMLVLVYLYDGVIEKVSVPTPFVDSNGIWRYDYSKCGNMQKVANPLLIRTLNFFSSNILAVFPVLIAYALLTGNHLAPD